MARMRSEITTESSDAPLTAEAWQAQEPCSECGGRPGRDPTSGMLLRIKLPNGEWEEGHTYQCQKRRQE